MPVLTTTGKNLFDMKYVGEELVSRHTGFVNNDDGSWTITTIRFHYGYKYKPINFKENTQYTLSATISSKTTNIGTVMGFLYTDGTFNYISSNTNTLTSVINKTIECITFSYGVGGTVETWSNIQLEEGSQATSYEPYKSNILSAPEDLELRGIGDVKDTLDLMTGEVIERISSFKPTNAWSISNELENTVLFTIKPPQDMDLSSTIISDKLPSVSPDGGGLWDTDIEGIGRVARGDLIRIRLAKTKASTLQEFENYMQSNPITIQYHLKSESIKTVDLKVVNQNGENVSLKPIEGTMNLSTSSETINPLFSGEIPVEAITQNLSSFIEE